MATKLETTKVTPLTLTNIRLISALTGEPQYEVFERLAQQERDRLMPPAPAGDNPPKAD